MHEFPETDPYWVGPKKFLVEHILPGNHVVAPAQFINQVPGVFTYACSRMFAFNHFDYGVVHKGELADIGKKRLSFFVHNYTPVFANEVFVIFSRGPNSPIDRTSNHYRSFLESFNALPEQDANSANSPESRAGVRTDVVDYEPAIAFLKIYKKPHQVIVAPVKVRGMIKPSISEDRLTETSPGTIDYAVISLFSASRLPYQDLKIIVDQYHLVYSDTLCVIYSRAPLPQVKKPEESFTRILRSSLDNGTFNISFHLYRLLLTGE